MEEAGEVAAEEKSMYEDLVKNKIDSIKHLNGINQKEETIDLKRRNGNIIKDVDGQDIDSVDIIKEKFIEAQQDNTAHIGNGDVILINESIENDKSDRDNHDEKQDCNKRNGNYSSGREDSKDEFENDIVIGSVNNDKIRKEIDSDNVKVIEKIEIIPETVKNENTIDKSKDTDIDILHDRGDIKDEKEVGIDSEDVEKYKKEIDNVNVKDIKKVIKNSDNDNDNDMEKKESIADKVKEEQIADTSKNTNILMTSENTEHITEDKSDDSIVPEKIKFKLNDKIRNSLKGLQDKVKSTPEKPENDQLTLSNDTDCKSPITTPVENIDDELKETQEAVPYVECSSPLIPANSKDKDSDKNDILEQASQDEDDVLLQDTSDDVPMEIGSDDEANEEDLLDIASESTAQKDPKCMEVNQSISCLTDKVQFDEDSNSNSTSAGKVNEIVKFLDENVSNTPSPMTIDKQQDSTSIDNFESSKSAICDSSEESSSLKSNTTISNVSESNENVSKEKDISEKNIADDKELKKPVENTSDENTQSPNVVNSKDEDDDDDDVIICESIAVKAKKPAKEENYISIDISESDKNHQTPCVEDDDVVFEKEVKSSDVTNDKKSNCDTNQVKKKLDETNIKDNTDKIIISPETTKSKQSVIDKNEVKTNIKTDVDMQQNDRKRPAGSDSEMKETDSKRSKLDLSGLIGKLGSRVQPVELTDSDEESEDTETASQVTEKESMDSETDVKIDKSEKEKDEYRMITEKELQEIVQKKVKEYLTAQRDTLLIQLSQKVKELQLSNDLWKKQVKDLQVKVNDVTVLQQKLEERKAKTDALRQITKRSVGLQVDDGRTSTGTSNPALRERLAASVSTGKTMSSSQPRSIAVTKSPSHKTPESIPVTKVLHAPGQIVTALPGSNGTIRLPIPQSSQPMLTQHLTPGQMSVAYKPPSVKSLLDTTRKQPTISSTPVTPPTTTPTSVINLVQLPRLMTSGPNSQGYVTVSQVGQPVTKVVSKSATGSVTTIDLTDDEEGAKTRLLTIPANAINAPPGMQVLPPGTQLIRAPGPNSQYQLVFNSSSPAIRPTMIPAGITTGPQTTILKTLPPTNAITLTSPTSLPPGTRVTAPLVQIPPTVLPPPAPPKPQTITVTTHPAAFPQIPIAGDPNAKLPPKPVLKISRVSQGIVLSWNMSSTESQAEISSYQLFAYQETQAPPSPGLWKKVGDVKALPLPMACTLTQFQVGNKYHFAVRSMDNKGRVGNFSDPSSIYLTPVVPTSSSSS